MKSITDLLPVMAKVTLPVVVYAVARGGNHSGHYILMKFDNTEPTYIHIVFNFPVYFTLTSAGLSPQNQYVCQTFITEPVSERIFSKYGNFLPPLMKCSC